MKTTVFPLLGEASFDAAKAGKKAASLHELALAKGPVPPGFVIDSSMREQIHSLRDEIVAATVRIGGFPVAVRSSSSLEDLGAASFAGLYETFLGVQAEDELLRRIEDCFRSGASERVREYLAKTGLSSCHPRVSVLVQKMVEARSAGVFFTLHPLSGKEEEGLIEACRGLGDRLVSAQVTPTGYLVDLLSETAVATNISDDGDVLSPEEIRDLVRKGIEIQALFGLPQDIEWAIDTRGCLVILQSRPITAMQWRKDVDEFTNADFKDGGVSARVCTPLMFSLYENAMQASMQRYFTAIKLLEKNAPQKQWIRYFYGRAYWNASEVKRRLFRVPGFDEQTFDLDLGIQKTYGESGPVKVPENLRTILPVLPVAFALEREYNAQLSRTKKYGEGFLAREREYRDELAALGKATLAKSTLVMQAILDFQRTTEIDYFTTIYNNANLQSDFKRLLEGIEKRTGYKPSVVKLYSGLDDVSHMKIQSGLLTLVEAALGAVVGSPEWLALRDEYLRDNYYHADAELDMMCPRWEDEPARIDAIVTALVKNPEALRDPTLTAEQQGREFEAEKAAVLGALDKSLAGRLWQKRKFVREIARVRTYLKRREEMRDYSTRAYHLVRRAVLSVGRKLVAAGGLGAETDVFFLNTSELVRIVDRSDRVDEIRTARSLVARRRLHYEGYRSFAPPNELGSGVLPRSEESFRGKNAEGKTVLRGLGCSPGQITGRVRVVRTLGEAYALEAGEILVTRFTDPGWTPVLGMASGVITEVGGMLSHAAIIGREYGIVAILNLPGATKALETGQLVAMNGETGEVVVG